MENLSLASVVSYLEYIPLPTSACAFAHVFSLPVTFTLIFSHIHPSQIPSALQDHPSQLEAQSILLMKYSYQKKLNPHLIKPIKNACDNDVNDIKRK